MRLVPATIVALALAAGLAPANANDSTAELTTGGLVLERNAAVEMRSEDLAISEPAIDVRYVFVNHTAADVTTTVAFPMPDIAWEGPDTNIAVPEPNDPNFLAFETFIDGRPVAMQREEKAIVDGRDVSERLRGLGVPLAPQGEATGKALDALPRSTQDELVAEKIVAPDDFDAGKGWEHHVSPLWTYRSAYFWRQTFPAGREVAIEHRYRPSVGATTGTMLEMSPIDPQALRRYETRYCVDRDFLEGVRAAHAREAATNPDGEAFFEKRIAYVLKTGANWAGPIGDFRLTVDKGAPDSLVSFCGEGVRKIGPTLFEMRKTNFTPTRDLDILILYRPPKN